MAEFELNNYVDLTEQELKAARTVLATAISPLLFYLSTLGYVPSLPALTKWMATASILAFLVATLAWGLGVTICQLTLTSVQFERVKGRQGEELGTFIKSAWTKQNNATAKLFRPAGILIATGYLTLAAFVGLVVWHP
jgi:hypothetical protein